MEQDDKREVWNNTAQAILIPPDPRIPHQSWRAYVYSNTNPGKAFFGTRCLPGRIIDPCTDQHMDKKSIMGYLVQITNADQYVYIRGAKNNPLVFEAFSGEISLAQDLIQEKKIILPGETPKPKPEGPLYLTEITFSMHKIKDHNIIDRIVNTVWRG